MSSLLVPDVSEWQGVIDWPELVKPYPAVIMRVHNGYREDHYAATNRSSAHHAGVRALGLYAFLVADRHPEDQAAEFVHAVGHLQAGEWPIVDCETGAGDQSARVKAWGNYVARALGTGKAWLYSGESFYRAHGLDHAGYPATRTWLAAYGPHEPAEGHALWQYTDHRTVPGVKSPVDCSTYHGTVSELVAAVTPPVAGSTSAVHEPTPGPTTHASHPFPTGIHPGGSSPSAVPLQKALKLTGWMDPKIAESDHYGPVTQHAVGGFNNKHRLDSLGKTFDPAIGPRGWALLMTLAYGA